MTVDDVATLAALDTARDIFRSNIESHDGRVIDMAGDSVLAVFDTAIGAVSASLSIQECLTAQAEGVTEHLRMQFRIGIHLGDVLEKADGTVYGDGVNIAARLQALAAPGGVTVSQAVRDAVFNRIGADFEDIGEQTVKNISQPVRAFLLLNGLSEGTDDRQSIENITKRGYRFVGQIEGVALPVGLSERRVMLVVLPFKRLGGRDRYDYFSEGLTEEMITQLARLSPERLGVIARTSAMHYKSTAKTIRQIGRELGVSHALEGSVRRAGDRVRIAAQLIRVSDDTHLWAETYEGNRHDILALQVEVARAIAREIEIKLTPYEQRRLDRTSAIGVQAHEAYLKGRHFW
jgi:TolB-like protein